MTTTLSVGERFIRQRNFKPAEYGTATWWLLGLSQDGATAHGVEVVEIVEIIETKTIGTLVIYRQWIIDPDGQEYSNRFVPDRNELNFATRKTCASTSEKCGSNALARCRHNPRPAGVAGPSAVILS